jgi:26S proteasome regulatory subunit N10
MSMEGGASGSAAVADAAMAEAGAVDPDLALGVCFSTFSYCLQSLQDYRAS